MASPSNLIGFRYNKLTVLSVSHRTPDRVWHWNCRCDCGETLVVAGKKLKSGHTKSCGCVHGIAIDTPIQWEQLFQLLHYEPQTGLFTSRVTGRSFIAGAVAGHIRTDRYVRISLGNVSYYAHQLAWFFVTGKWVDLIDHEDTNPSNNRWANLREATPTQSVGNTNLATDNTSGFKGVSFRNGKFRAVCHGIDLGTFDAAEKAACVY